MRHEVFKGLSQERQFSPNVRGMGKMHFEALRLQFSSYHFQERFYCQLALKIPSLNQCWVVSMILPAMWSM